MRFVALDKQHGSIEQALTEAFARLLRASGYTFGAEVKQCEAEHVAEAAITTEGARGARC